MGLMRVIRLSIVPMCICRLWVVVLDVSDMFVVAGLQITTCLANIRVVAHVAFQLVNTWTIVRRGFCFGCCFD